MRACLLEEGYNLRHCLCQRASDCAAAGGGVAASAQLLCDAADVKAAARPE
jgi:hypothetical protein